MRDNYTGLMSRIREAVESGSIPEPTEGEVVERCRICGAESVYRKSANGNWRIESPTHIGSLHTGGRQVNDELEPPTRTIGEED